MIIDCHCHAGKGDGFTGPWDTDAPLEKYLARARAAGIRKTVLFPAFHSDYERANRQLAQIVHRPAKPVHWLCFRTRRQRPGAHTSHGSEGPFDATDFAG